MAAPNPHGIDPNRPYNKNCYLTTHNSYAAKAYGWAYYQQTGTVSEQLQQGVRALMLDIWQEKGEIFLFHEGHAKSRFLKPDQEFSTLTDMFKEVKEFLDQNPREIVTCLFETYVTDPTLTQKAIADAGVADLIYWADGQQGCKDCRDQVWPTLNQMADLGRRLVLFSYKYGQDGMPYQWDYMTESVYGDDSLNPSKWAVSRANNYPLSGDKSMFILNHFPSFALNLFGKMGWSKTDSQNDSVRILEHVEAAKVASGIGRLPNFIAVDMFEEGNNGGAPEGVAKVNGFWGAGAVI